MAVLCFLFHRSRWWKGDGQTCCFRCGRIWVSKRREE